MSLSKKLSMIVNGNNSDIIDAELSGVLDSESIIETPKSSEEFDDETITFDSLSIDSYLNESGYKKSKKKKKAKSNKYKSLLDDIEDTEKKTTLEKITETTNRLLNQRLLDSAVDFDAYLDDSELFALEENDEMRNNLISMGRKYARDSASSKESSEISKSFADSEKRLKALYEELDRDKMSVQKDIDRMRVPGRGGKTFADLISVKNAMQSTQLSIVKEINALRKSVYDLRAKEAARKDAENFDNKDITTNTLQSIFSSARSSLVNSMGGYAEVSGARNTDDSENVVYDDNIVSDEMDDEEIQRRYFSSKENDSPVSDGDKFLEYENRGVEYVLLVDEDNNVNEVIAEDRDGMRIFDYPLPQNVKSLNFEMDFHAGIATDNMHRNYKIRKDNR